MIIPSVDENGKGKIFVQKVDIKKLVELNLDIPAKLLLPFISGKETITEDNKYDFLVYEDFDRELNNYFNSHTWIIEYSRFFDFSPSEFQILKFQILDELNAVKFELSNQIISKDIKKYLTIKMGKIKHYLDSVIYFESIKNNMDEFQNLSNLAKNSR